MRDTLYIQGRGLGPGKPVLIVAELSANHLNDYKIAEKTLRAMKAAGADAVKLQTYTADTLTIDHGNRYFRIKSGLWRGKTLYELYREAAMPWEWQPRLKRLADRLGMICFSTPFDPTSLDFLESTGMPAYKIASFEITDIPLISLVAAKRKPVIISTGMAERDDIAEAVNACRKSGNDRVILLKCTSAYPAPVSLANMRLMTRFAEDFGCPYGVSDHSTGNAVAAAAAALGCRVIERHFILDRRLGGPDAAFSLEPGEFARMVRLVREVEQAMGDGEYGIPAAAGANRIFCRSLFVVKDMARGEKFTDKNVRSIRPGYGLKPGSLKAVLGKKCRVPIKRGTPLQWHLVKR